VHHVQVDVVDAELFEAAFSLRNRVLAAGPELCGDEYLLARDAALAQALPDAVLVAVGLGRVDVPVSELERPADRVDAFGSVRHLPDAEPEHRHLVPVREFPRGPDRVRDHRCSSTGGYGRLTRVSVMRPRSAGASGACANTICSVSGMATWYSAGIT
jgi:hypothetical protein